MQLLYHDSAQANDCYIVSSCGMDSVPVDLGVIHFMKNFDGMFGDVCMRYGKHHILKSVF